MFPKRVVEFEQHFRSGGSFRGRDLFQGRREFEQNCEQKEMTINDRRSKRLPMSPDFFRKAKGDQAKDNREAIRGEQA